MVKTYAYGFPRIGKNREYKKLIEGFWKENISQEELIRALDRIDIGNRRNYSQDVDGFPTNEMTMYDKMLDTACMVGLYSPKDGNDYYDLCRGKDCLEMTKWFNTNYHYLVPDFSKWNKPNFKYSVQISTDDNNPHLIGPFTFLKLSKGIPEDQYRDYALQLAKVYKEIISDFEFDLSDIIPERIIWGNDMGNFRLRMIIPAAVAFSWVIMRNGEREENDRGVPIIHLSWFREEGDVVNIDNRYNLNILDVQGGEADSENVVTLRLDRANPIL